MLIVEGLARSFGERQAVADVSFTVGPGETYGLLGPNGSGKTTTMSMISGILRADAGTVTIEGQALDHRASAAKSRIGLVPQELAIYEDLTARENLVFFGRLQRLEPEHLGRRIDEVLEIVALADRADDLAGEFSGGMQRRLNIAIGLLHEPALLILDEPTVGVDPQSRNQILDAVDELGGAGLSVIYTTHYMEEAERLCDRVGILDGGRVLAEGTRTELVERLGEAATIRLELGEGATTEACAALGALDGVQSAVANGGGIDVLTARPDQAIAPVVSTLSGLGLAIAGVRVDQPDLEAVFLDLTGRALRD